MTKKTNFLLPTLSTAQFLSLGGGVLHPTPCVLKALHGSSSVNILKCILKDLKDTTAPSKLNPNPKLLLPIAPDAISPD